MVAYKAFKKKEAEDVCAAAAAVALKSCQGVLELAHEKRNMQFRVDPANPSTLEVVRQKLQVVETAVNRSRLVAFKMEQVILLFLTAAEFWMQLNLLCPTLLFPQRIFYPAVNETYSPRSCIFLQQQF